jgi:hypothetical protein
MTTSIPVDGDEPIPALNRRTFVDHLARLRQHIVALHDQLRERRITPITLAPLVVPELEDGQALTVSLLRAELKLARQALLQAHEEIDQHQREILALQDQLAEAQSEGSTARQALVTAAKERDPEAPPLVRVPRPHSKDKPSFRGPNRPPGIIVALTSIGKPATAQELAHYMGATLGGVNQGIYRHKDRIHRERGPDGLMTYRLASASSPAPVLQPANESSSP